MRILSVIFCFIFTSAYSQKLVDYVNPFIGTSNFGATNPGAVVPHGMVSVSPFNVSRSPHNVIDKDARWWSTPYHYENRFFTGFTQANLSGVGCPELGIFLVMPTSGEVDARVEKYGSIYSGDIATPGYYSNFLDKYGIRTGVTATKRAGLMSFMYPAGKANILIDLGNGLTNESGGILKIVSSSEVEGMRMTGNFCYSQGTERPVYFVAKINKSADSYGVWKKMPEMTAEAAWSETSNQFKYYQGYKSEIAGDSIGAYFSFNLSSEEEIMIKVGISYVSIENARENLESEIPGFGFSEVRKNAEEQWENVLSRIIVEGGTADQRTVFYTALYHMNLHPNVLNDVNGQYPGMESHQIMQVNGRERYTTFSLWDTYRNLHPFMSLVYPEVQLDMVKSAIDMYDESGWLPKWELNSKETHVMEGDPAIPLIVDTWFRGLKDFDYMKAWEAMYKSATTPEIHNKIRPDVDDYHKLGYLPILEEFDNSVSQALEYYVADWNLAQFAKALGYDNEYQRFYKQSLGYKNYYDKKEFGVFRPKLRDGSFLTPFNPEQGIDFEPVPGFHEGTAWQYTFYVPHDVNGLIKLMGGEKAFTAKLQKVFDNDLFDMANEPDINYPYLFSFIKGEEWRTQKEVRKLIDTYYSNAPAGLPGNDDCGTMSAWVAFSMMGFYPVCPGNMNYVLTSPVFDKVTIYLDNRFYPGEKFEIIANRVNETDNYIKNIRLNSRVHRTHFLNHSILVEGGSLEFNLTEAPGK